MEATIDFYERILGFERLGENRIGVAEGGFLRQVLFDIGEGQFVAFMEAHDVPEIAVDYDTGINAALGVPNMFYHFAFGVESLEALDTRRSELIAHGVSVSSLVEHGPATSFYVKDPNRVQLEFTVATRELDEEDAAGSFEIRRAMLDPED
jgi:catechol 2,3-dioxygenase-like lactoylglutathione lyase family enzyme